MFFIYFSMCFCVVGKGVFLLGSDGGMVPKETFIHVQTRLDLEFCHLYMRRTFLASRSVFVDLLQPRLCY